MFFGLQSILQKYLYGKVVTRGKIDEAESVFKAHIPTVKFNREGWTHILEKHGGMLPLEIRAVPEGTVVAPGNVLMTIHNTDPECYWLTNYVESILMHVWYPTTVCTRSREQKRVILDYLKRTGDPSLIDFKLHDFGLRGSTSVESAAIGGVAHLVNFRGTDNMPAIMEANASYNVSQLCGPGFYDDIPEFPGFSIPASEHSTMTSWLKEGEVDAMRNMLMTYPDTAFACVSDSYDIYNACAEIWGNELRDLVMQRPENAPLIIRPDSGDPVHVVLEVIAICGDKFGYTVNDKGFKVLNPRVRIIQGDGVNIHTIRDILDALEGNKWSADNIAFGSGGALLQKVNRDTFKCAIKCSAILIEDGWMTLRQVQKTPITASWKKSKAGLLALCRDESGDLKTVSHGFNPGHLFTQIPEDLLRPVFCNGRFVSEIDSLKEIRERARLK